MHSMDHLPEGSSIPPSVVELMQDPSLMETMSEDEIRMTFLNAGYRRKNNAAVGIGTKYFFIIAADGRVLNIIVNGLSFVSIDCLGGSNFLAQYCDPDVIDGLECLEGSIKCATLGNKFEELWKSALKRREQNLRGESKFRQLYRRLFG